MVPCKLGMNPAQSRSRPWGRRKNMPSFWYHQSLPAAWSFPCKPSSWAKPHSLAQAVKPTYMMKCRPSAFRCSLRRQARIGLLKRGADTKKSNTRGRRRWTMRILVDTIIAPYFEKTKADLRLPSSQCSVWKIDCWSVNQSTASLLDR